MLSDEQLDKKALAAGFVGETLKTTAAFLAGAYAVRRFEAVPLGVQRQTLEVMQQRYAETGPARSLVLPQFPPLVRMGRDACLEAAVASGSHCSRTVRGALEAWPEPTETAAHEVLGNEAKFRSLLWAVLAVRAAEASDTPSAGMEDHVFKAIRGLVTQLNDFAQMVELGLFAETDVFGLLHRSIAPTCKALEPVIWARSASGGRWGLRLLRLRLRAEHFNDMRTIHASSPLIWTGQAARPVCIHEALYRPAFNRLEPTERLKRMALDDRLQLEWETRYTRIRPRFGGSRLRLHIAAESRLAGSLKYALNYNQDPLDFSWSMEGLSNALRSAHGQISGP